MTDELLTKDKILDATEQTLRRYGPAKTTMQDVARTLGVSHAALYRYYDGKAALRSAVADRWLHHICAPLDALMSEPLPPEVRLRRWLETLIASKRRSAQADPELFTMYAALASDVREVVQRHLSNLTDQISLILAAGVESGAFAPMNVPLAARAVLAATSRFHNPAFSSQWQKPDEDELFNTVWSLLLQGLARRSEIT